MTKALATKDKNALAATAFFDDDGATGFENTDSSDLILSRIGIIQDLSPQLKKNNEKYLPDAEVGDYADLTINKLISKQGSAGFRFLPVLRTKEVIEWRPRAAGGGIESRELITPTHQFSDIAQERNAVKTEGKSEWKLQNGNEIIETWQFFGLNLSDSAAPCFIPVKKGGLQAARIWYDAMSKMTLPNGKQAKMFYSTWDFDSVLKATPGGDYMNFSIKPGPLLQELDGWQEIAATAVAFQETHTAGTYVAELNDDDAVDNADAPF